MHAGAGEKMRPQGSEQIVGQCPLINIVSRSFFFLSNGDLFDKDISFLNDGFFILSLF